MSLRGLSPLHYKIHPLIFALYFPLALWAANLGEITPSTVLRPVFAALIFSGIIWGVSWIIVRDWEKSALITSVAVVLFFNYGHIYNLIKTWAIGDILIGRHRWLVPLWGILLLGWSLWVIRFKGRMDAAGRFFTLVAMVLLALPAFNIGRYYLPEILQKPPAAAPGQSVSQATVEQDLPDIYYIVVDAYGRSDVLKDLYDYDNSNFISYLNRNGFTVAEKSHSNYNLTALSLASTLNMDYMNDLAGQMDKSSMDRRPLIEKIAHSRALDILQGLGYQFVTFETGSLVTLIEDSSIYLAPSYEDISQEEALLAGVYLNDFEGLFLKTTLVRVWLDEYLSTQNTVLDFAIEFPYLKHRTRILFTFDQLGKIPAWDGNYFIFAHILSPHPPFIFDSQGGTLQHSQPISYQDTGCCSDEEYIAGYREQVAYITKQLQQTIDTILSQSDIPPVIIVQGDHGPGAYYDGFSMDELKTYERMSILNAYYFPQPAEPSLYASITPVNSFRVLFSSQFEMDFPLLPDKSYFSPGARPYDLSELPPEWLQK
jgi:hypothetical protein